MGRKLTVLADCLVTAWQLHSIDRQLATDGTAKLDGDLVLGQGTADRHVSGLDRNCWLQKRDAKWTAYLTSSACAGVRDSGAAMTKHGEFNNVSSSCAGWEA